MKGILLTIACLIAPGLFAQNLIINNAFVKITGSSNVIQLDSATSAVSSTTGGIQTDKGTGFIWRIGGSSQKQYTVPFADQYGTAIPVKIKTETAAQPKNFNFQTWQADTADLAGFGSTVTIKRMWKIDGLQRPVQVELKYADTDIPQSLLGESLLAITRLWNGQWSIDQNSVVNPAQNSISYTANDPESYSTTWTLVEIDIPLATNIRWINYECTSSELAWESDMSDYTYIIYGSNDGSHFVAIDSSRTQSRFNSTHIGPKYKYLKIEQKFNDHTKYESKPIKTCSIRVPISLEVYPNPTTGRIWIENATDPSIEVRDLTGKSLLMAATDRLDIGNLVNGIYFVTVQDGETSKNFRIVKI